MRLIKLDAIDSTNEFLKKLAADQHVGNHTVVTAENQTAGKGQMGAVWQSAVGKNLIMSMLFKDIEINPARIFILNAAVALAVVQVLEAHELTDIKIKWPNDIMAGGKKIGGILIENIFSGVTVKSVVGIGLNVNQRDFEHLPRASSLLNFTGVEWDRDLLLQQLVTRLKLMANDLKTRENKLLSDYNDKLFRRGITCNFRSAGEIFTATILQVAADGLLQVIDRNHVVTRFDLKQIEMLY